MPRFTDSTGREWSVELTFGDIKRIRSRMGVDLMGLLDGDPPLVDRLRDDLELSLNLVFAAVEPEAVRLNVSDEEFGRSLGGPAAAGALAALWGAIADFFRGLRPAATAAAERVMALRRSAAALLTMVIEMDRQEGSGESPTGQAVHAACSSTA